MHVESTCIRVLIECPKKQHGYTCVSTMHVESTCIRVLIECPKKTTRGARVLLMLCVEITHAVKHAC